LGCAPQFDSTAKKINFTSAVGNNGQIWGTDTLYYQTIAKIDYLMPVYKPVG